MTIKNMSLNFPSRFLKKLNIYQQIRKGQGISNHKKLWKYEAAFLQTSYNKGHQHLNSFVGVGGFIEWIVRSESSYDKKNYEEIIGNLFFRGYLDIKHFEALLEKSRIAYSNHKLVHGKDRKSEEEVDRNLNARFGATMEGLLVGEVVSEIKNKNCLLKRWNQYKYNLVLDSIWLFAFAGIAKIVLPSQITTNIHHIKIRILGAEIGYIYIILAMFFIIWPFANWLYRKIYSALEDRS